MVRFLAIYVFLALAAENYAEFPFAGKWETVFRPLGDLLYRPSPIKAPGVAVLLMVLLLKIRKDSGSLAGRSPYIDKALWLHLGTTVCMVLWGLARDGLLPPALQQIQTLLFMPLSGFLFIAGLRSEEDFRVIGKAIIYAAIYRAFLVIYFYFFVAPGLFEEMPLTMTTHADTILFSTAIVALMSWALEERSKQSARTALMISALLIVAVQLNNRRLAYVSIAGAMLVLYILLEKSDLKRNINRKLIAMAPVIAIYLAVGGNSDSAIFKPAKAFSSMFGSKQDASSMTRDIENYNLIITLTDHPIMGSGWGHEYHEVSIAYSIADIFPLYRYIPHNSILGLWAFAGFVGSTGLWLCMVVTAYLSVRSYRSAATPLGRTLCATALCEISIYGLQAYGDMGLYAWNGNLIMGVTFAAASRMSMSTGAFEPPLEA